MTNQLRNAVYIIKKLKNLTGEVTLYDLSPVVLFLPTNQKYIYYNLYQFRKVKNKNYSQIV
jgi:hypothetical protein